MLAARPIPVTFQAPHFVSDFTDALNLQCLATICFMYFALLAPIVTFGGLLEEATHQRMAAMENLFGGGVFGISHRYFSYFARAFYRRHLWCGLSSILWATAYHHRFNWTCIGFRDDRIRLLFTSWDTVSQFPFLGE